MLTGSLVDKVKIKTSEVVTSGSRGPEQRGWNYEHWGSQRRDAKELQLRLFEDAALAAGAGVSAPRVGSQQGETQTPRVGRQPATGPELLQQDDVDFVLVGETAGWIQLLLQEK